MKKILIIFLFLVNFPCNAENIQIYTLVKVNNSIITNIDLEKEIEVLKILNSNLATQKIDIKKLALNNLINENLKKTEIQKNNVKIEEKNIFNHHTKLLESLKNNNIKTSKKLENLIYSKIKLEYEWNELIANKYAWQTNINMQEIQKKLEDNKTPEDMQSLINIEKNKKLNVYSNNHLENLKKNSLIKFYK